MRAINSARALSVHLKTRCVILWINDWNNCNCRYSDLFLKAESTWLVEGSFANWITPLSPVFYHKKLDYSEVAQKINDTDFFESLDPDQRIYLRTYDAFYPYEDSRSFIPVPHLMERIQKVTSTFDGSTVGIHIRRGDHSWSNEHSPTEKFIRSMEQEIREDPSVNFFVATDSPEEERVMLSRFGDRIKVRKKIYSRASLPGMGDALVDMYCLAATQRLYTSWCSSFSTIASQINNREMITVYE
jgi:hypothetical protein